MRNGIYNRYEICTQSPHVVLLGAGASLAAFPNGDKNGLRLPLMKNFVTTIIELKDFLSKQGIDYIDSETNEEKNFEDLYSELYEDNANNEIRVEIEKIIDLYFSEMELPEEPTLYDHLVLSLTNRDVVATFNWDPFLLQAYKRNCLRIGDRHLPILLFLHGNTGIGICLHHEKPFIGSRGHICPHCINEFKRFELLEPSKLLYPIKMKNYFSDIVIEKNWKILRNIMKDAYMFTIFGYGAPSSDVEAVKLLSEGWGDKYQREMEQIEVIDTANEDVLRGRWNRFIHTHHYEIHKNFYSSMIGKCSRRSTDACSGANYHCIAWEEHPIPQDASWNELDEWLEPYIKVENATRENM